MKSILVIDDNQDLRSVIASILTAAGYSVRQAQDGHEGIRMLIDQRPDLIICDVKMPGLDGYRTLDAIRKCSTTAAIPFILITGSMGPEDFRRGMTCGADDYLTKPFTPSELKAAVKSRLALRNSIQTDFLRRSELEQFKQIQQLAEGFSNPLQGMLSAVSAKLKLSPLSQGLETNGTENNLPVFCLD